MVLGRRERGANKELAGRGLVTLDSSMSRPGTVSRVELSAVGERERLALTRPAETIQWCGRYGTLAVEFSLGKFQRDSVLERLGSFRILTSGLAPFSCGPSCGDMRSPQN
jgi:hypothetical protein